MRKKLTLAMLTALAVSLSGCSGQNAPSESSSVEADKETSAANDESSADSQLSDADVGTGDKYECVEDDAHAIEADNETVSYDNINVEKTGDGEGDEADFYGTNAAVYAENGAELDITNSYIHSNGSHANAVFSYGEDTVINISNSIIVTDSNNSGGIMVTGGGTLNADNLKVTTQSGSSAAIRSDRGGGTINVNGGEFKSYGKGSPAIYSTADITVNDAVLYSDISQAVVVEGNNSVTLNNTDATGKNTDKNSDNSDRYQAVMIYQSMSGDADDGMGKFTMNGGTLTSLNEGMFYVTNTVAEINLDNVDLVPASDDLLRIEKAGWGNDGENGGQVTLNTNNQTLKGIITVDDISNLNMIMKGSSTFEGSIDNSGDVYVELDDNSVWTLTADTSISSLTCDSDAIDLNGYTLTVNGEKYKEGTASEGTAIEVTQYSSAQNSGKDGNPPQMGENGNPPEKPEGNPPEMNGSHGNPPEKPDGNPPEMNGDHGNPPEKPDGKPGDGKMERPDETESTTSSDAA